MKPKLRDRVMPVWEREVQVGIRQLRPPLARGEVLLLGLDEEGIAAVAHTCELDGPSVVKILAIGRAHRLRGTGLGEEVLEETINVLASRADAAGCSEVMIYGVVHEMNKASQAMVDDAGFFYRSTDEGYQDWWLRLDLADE